MRSRTAKWFICKIRYEKVNEDGLQKKSNRNLRSRCFEFFRGRATYYRRNGKLYQRGV